MEVVVNDSVTREAISRAEERKFLRFVKEDPYFCRYYEGIYILFKTGLRISEFCGLTISDIDFKEHTINIDHQLQKKSKIGYYIQQRKQLQPPKRQRQPQKPRLPPQSQAPAKKSF